ncbi:septal ring lytic transglycosylase RlpA family protein [Nonomuraea sp. NPDC050783]|uniref:septal ring lytic transglycosylase RlpA family protein n=1 Tax=Nonomuraea sp. NPDC050783 TaxID=3154634 RepID=UPI003465096B
MGQHSTKPFPTGKRRWTAIAAGAAVIATASTSAYAAIANDDAPKRTPTAAKPADSATPEPKALNGAARRPNPKPSSPEPLSPASEPPAAATPNPATRTARPAEPGTTRTAKTATEKPVAEKPVTEKRVTEKPVTKKTVAGKPKARVLSSGSCGASFYDEPQMTASGERFNPSALTAAHKTLPLGSRVRVINPRNGKAVTVRINDRGPYVGGRCLDLSAAAFSAIGNTNAGVMRVKYQVLAR